MTQDKIDASKKISILDLLDDVNYRTYHISVARYLKSINAAIMLSELIGKYKYHLSRNELTDDGWFYHTHEAIEMRTVLTRREQDSALNILISFGMVEKKLIGLPAKRHFKINELKILEMIGNEINKSSLYKNAKLGCTTENIGDPYNLDCTKTPNCIGEKRQTSHNTYEPKEEPKKEIKDCATSVAMSADADDLLSFFNKKLHEQKPDFKFPKNLKKWRETFDLMIRVDKRDPKKLKAMIEWIRKDSFWKSIVLSPENLRKNYDRIDEAAKFIFQENNSHKNKTWALSRKKAFPETYKSLEMTDKYAKNLANGQEISMNLPEQTFRPAFVKIFGLRWEDISPSDK